MKMIKVICLGILLTGSGAGWAQTASKPDAKAQGVAKSANGQKTNTAKQQAADGQVFDHNCSRCHNAPQGFSSSVAGTVARHMRVKANLSAADEQAILRFLNP